MNLIQQVFLNQMTEDGINELKSRYPKGFMDNVKMSDDSQFKDARAIRTERNKLVKAINDKRISFTGEVKNYSDSIVDQINDIYDPIVAAFELENDKRKQVKIEEERRFALLLEVESKRIKEIKLMVDSARNSSSGDVQNIIEAVDMIDTSDFHKDLIHEAIEVKDSVLSDLSGLLSSVIASEKVEEERAKLKIESDKLKRGQEIQHRVDVLRMIPSNFFGKKSFEISKQIGSLSGYEIKEDDFDDRVKEVVELLTETLIKLKEMRDQAVEMEEFKEHQAKARVEEEARVSEIAREASEIDKSDEVVNNIEPEKISLTAVPAIEETEYPKSGLGDNEVKGFLEVCVNDQPSINDFGHMLISDDAMIIAQAVDLIKERFNLYINA